MIPPIFQILSDDPAVTGFLGSNPLRIFPFSEAPENSLYPYATYTVIFGEPDNSLNDIPLIDKLNTQVDIWGSSAASVLDTAAAVRDALEPHAHMVGTGSMEREPETKSYRVRLEFDFFTER